MHVSRPVAGILALVLLVGGGALLFPHLRSVHGQQQATMTLQPPDGPKYPNANFTLPSGAQIIYPANTTFPATVLLAIGTYGPNTITLPNASAGMGVDCVVTNFNSTSYVATGIAGSGTASVTLYVSAPLATNSTAPNVRCFAF